MGLFDRFRSPEKQQLAQLKRLEQDEQRKRLAFQERERERALMALSRWTYDEIRDEMRGTASRIATLVSSNTVEFDFPYQGGSFAIITIRFSGRHREVMLSVSTGQFDHDMTNFQIGKFVFNAKADQGAIRTWSASESDSGLPSLMFISDAYGFVQQFQNAKRLIVEPSFYQHGRAQFTFEPVGLKKEFRS